MQVDRAAYEQEALAVLDGMYRLALWLTARDADARDLVQETYLRALEARETFRRGASMRAWLACILRNRFLDHRRRKAVEVLQSESDEDSNVFEDTGQTEAPLFGDAELGRLTSLVRGDIGRALQSLPENHRTVVLLCDVEQWLWQEAADVLQVPIGTVRSRLFRARRALRELLSEYAPKEARVDPVR